MAVLNRGRIITCVAIERTDFLYGVGTADPATFSAVIALLALVALLACAIPAARASRVDPMSVLRDQQAAWPPAPSKLEAPVRRTRITYNMDHENGLNSGPQGQTVRDRR